MDPKNRELNFTFFTFSTMIRRKLFYPIILSEIVLVEAIYLKFQKTLIYFFP
jgi:hypothetical protein